MRIAVLSDTHDHIWNLAKVLTQIKGEVEAIIHCGDVIAPFSVGMLATSELPTYVCLGNNDEDHIGMEKKANTKFTWIHIGQQFGEIEFDNRKVAFTHYPKLGELLAKSGEYDAVFYGHTHVSENKKFGRTLLLNPGSVCGIIDGKPAKASYAIYDTKTNSANIIEVK
uniref:Phosphoesterase n=1 Tax=uncultured Microgenomates bacterium Rifle_16ft_4_minimus_38077 TaxID=1665117 RepID=A0A0H4T9N2_9BACT|nr:phosphodiesterase [uncultured Microgenomates bacterium Rifle_16ft_4_minimus_38077]